MNSNNILPKSSTLNNNARSIARTSLNSFKNMLAISGLPVVPPQPVICQENSLDFSCQENSQYLPII